MPERCFAADNLVRDVASGRVVKQNLNQELLSTTARNINFLGVLVSIV